ncbi:MAG: tetratricopeptide repeat protein [bacterium]|nr:tetratricopeptide repeat protein [bacterium]
MFGLNPAYSAEKDKSLLKEAETYFQQGTEYEKSKKLKKAIESYKRAIQCDPNNAGY